MDKNQPLVSVLLPSYNRSKFIAQSVESVLNQTWENLELIIVDDGSSDNTEEVVSVIRDKDSRVVYLKNEKNLGLQKSLNKGLAFARGKYIARIDDQDRWIDVDKLSKQVNFLEDNIDYVLVGTGVVVEDLNGEEIFRFLNPERDSDIRQNLLLRNCFAHSSVVFDRESAVAFGGYDEDVLEDHRLWLQLGTVGKMFNLPDYSLLYVKDTASASHSSKAALMKKNLPMIKEYKSFYPRYTSALLRHYLRLLIYGYLKIDYTDSIIFRLKRMLNK